MHEFAEFEAEPPTISPGDLFGIRGRPSIAREALVRDQAENEKTGSREIVALHPEHGPIPVSLDDIEYVAKPGETLWNGWSGR